MTNQIFLGAFEYVNIWPIYYSFLFETPPPHFFIVSETPNRLNRYLEEGMLPASCISSIQYPFLQDKIYLFPSLALATSKSVKSVLLASKVQLKEIKGQKIFVPSASSTSVTLLKILLNAFNLHAEIISSPNPLLDFQKEGIGFLLIGDDALASLLTLNNLNLYDLGELWHQLTGKSFVWALWGIRKEALEDAPHIFNALLDSRRTGLNHLSFISDASSLRLSLSSKFMESYYQNFIYTLGQKEMEGLLLFYHLASQLELSPPCSQLHFVENESSYAKVCG